MMMLIKLVLMNQDNVDNQANDNKTVDDETNIDQTNVDDQTNNVKNKGGSKRNTIRVKYLTKNKTRKNLNKLYIYLLIYIYES